MIPSKFKEYLTTADLLYGSAEEEMLRGEEDVVTYKVCMDLKKTIEHYFKGYLSAKHIPFDTEQGLEYLLEKCQEADSEFQGITLKPFAFADHDAAEFINLTLDHATDCMTLAKQTRQLVHKKIGK